MKLDRKSYFSFSLIFVVVVQYAYCATVADEMVPISGSKETTCNCGKANRRTRIIGGQETEVNEYPWMVEIMVITETTPKVKGVKLCGGALIDNSYVVTAAHCFKNLTATDLIVDAGDHQLNITTETANKYVLVNKLTTHENYNPTTVANDIAVLKLATPLVYTRTILPACLPPLKFSMQSQLITITGYGATEQGGDLSNVLNEVEIPTINNSDCKSKYGKSKTLLAVIDDSVFCAGSADGSKDSCQGDSGSPAVVMCNDIYTFSGVVSYGVGCGNKNYPGVLTNISHYRNWIVTNAPGASLCEHKCSPKPPPPPPVECGVANVARRRKRVVGGTTTQDNQFPWMGAIFIKMENSYKYSCGATVLNNDWVVTSAKCVDDIDQSRLLVVLGVNNISIVENTKEQDFFVSQVIIHPEYDAPSYLNDIALLKLDGSAVYNQWVKPICLSSSMNKDFGLTNLNFIGWGRTSTTGAFSDKLKSVVLKTMSNNDCMRFPGYSAVVHSSTVCTASSSSGDVCEGDIGGPLMTVGSSSGKYFLAAVQAFRYGGSCGSGYPSGYTRVPYYMDWITQTTGVTTYVNSKDAFFS